jgi:hypothetical protein
MPRKGKSDVLLESPHRGMGGDAWSAYWLMTKEDGSARTAVHRISENTLAQRIC